MVHPVAAVFPPVLTVTCVVLLAIAVGCAVFVTVDVVRHPPRMRVMAVVWPLTMLFGSVVWLLFYLRRGRAGAPAHGRWAGTAIDTSHCGAGCALGDLIGESVLLVFPVVGVWFGLGTLYRDPVFAAWTVDFVIAFVLGIVFQYWAIAPMRELGFRAGVLAALKADTLSIAAWQVGMYGVMAVWQFVVFPAAFGGRADAGTPEFWVAMQVAMVAGFVCSAPVNAWLVRRGVKEAM
uniref:DUF4396 domain-containing protein n=1 Tax=Neobacillus citreus TaxID=2833578 RepID=A0A942T700_9BACI